MVILGVGQFRYEVAKGWGKLPGGWSFRECAAVGCDSNDNVYVFNRGLYIDQKVYVGELGVAIGPNSQALGLGPRVGNHDVNGNVLARLGDAPEGEEPGRFIAPHGVCINSRGDILVSGVSWTHTGSQVNPPREIRSLQKLTRLG